MTIDRGSGLECNPHGRRAVDERVKGWLLSLLFLLLLMPPSAKCLAVEPPAAIETVSIDSHRAIRVNGEPFFPLMAWLQDPDNFPLLRQTQMNATAGYWSKSGGTRDVVEYLERVRQAGLYGVMPFDRRLEKHPALLAYIHDDEPDLPRQVYDADIAPDPQLRINPSNPLEKIFDGVTHTWSVLDPLEAGQFCLRLEEAVELHGAAFWLTISPGLAVARQVELTNENGEKRTIELKNEKGRQLASFSEPLTGRELTFRVTATYPGENAWGSIGEIEGLDAAGRNVLVCPPRQVCRQSPADTQRHYQQLKQQDPAQPVFMTLTAYFMPEFSKWPPPVRGELYEGYAAAADVLGFDVYPIYGWNKPQWLDRVYKGTAQLTQLAGSRPVYAWIETSRGGQWTGPLENQHPVTPAHIRAEVWMAICGGATGIGYFTHVWKPSYKQFGVPPANVEAIRSINEQITRLAPAILAEPAEVAVAAADDKSSLPVVVLARRYRQDLYVFAVHCRTEGEAGAVTFAIDSLPAGLTVEVLDESRRLQTSGGGFRDQFAPLAVHLYRISKIEK